MKSYNKYILLLFIGLVLYIIFSTNLEEGYNGSRHGPRRRHRNRHGHGRRWSGSRYGYRYRSPPRHIRYGWYNPSYWFNGFCKNGCTNIGNDKWGCQYPGRGLNDCWTATDCYGCGY